MRHYWLSLMAMLLIGCAASTLPQGDLGSPTPLNTPMSGTSPILDSPSPVPASITPPETPSEGPTLPAPTLTPFTNTPGFQTPTAIVGNPTSPGIIEVTALGGEQPACDFLEAYFTPDYQMKVHTAANLSAAIAYYLPAGKRRRVCDEIQVLGDWWLCLDFLHDAAGNLVGSDCKEAVVYQIGTHIFGKFEVIQP